MAECFFFAKKRFMLIVKEIMADCVSGGVQDAMIHAGVRRNFRIEQDVLIALQIATETLFTNFFQMSYVS